MVLGKGFKSSQILEPIQELEEEFEKELEKEDEEEEGEVMIISPPQP